MGRAIELITGLATAPSSTFTSATALSGNSFTVRDSRKPITMSALWSTRQGAGVTRITSALLHDSSIGIQQGCGIGQAINIPMLQQVQAQDSLALQMTGSATAGDIEHASYLLEYDDLPGINGRFITPAEMQRKAVNFFGNTITISTGTTGQYTGQVSINSAQDGFKANTDYALVGYDVAGADCHAIRYVGPDWGNLGVGGPGKQNVSGFLSLTASWFVNLGVIPVMNSANKALTLIDAVVNENGGDPIVTTHWVELR